MEDEKKRVVSAVLLAMSNLGHNAPSDDAVSTAMQVSPPNIASTVVVLAPGIRGDHKAAVALVLEAMEWEVEIDKHGLPRMMKNHPDVLEYFDGQRV